MYDVELDFQGSIVLFRPVTLAAQQWMHENVSTESWQWLGGRLAVERRFAWDLVCGMREAALRVW